MKEFRFEPGAPSSSGLGDQIEEIEFVRARRDALKTVGVVWQKRPGIEGGSCFREKIFQRPDAFLAGGAGGSTQFGRRFPALLDSRSSRMQRRTEISQLWHGSC